MLNVVGYAVAILAGWMVGHIGMRLTVEALDRRRGRS
jgi:hypothetical protein